MWDEDPRAALVSNWHLNESGSNTRYDSRGGNHLTASGSTIGATTGLGGTDAMSLTRANQDHVGRASNSSLQFGDADWTFLAAVKADSFSGARVIAAKDGATREFLLYFANAVNRFQLTAWKPGPTAVTLNSDTWVAENGALQTGVWYVVAARHDASTDKLGIFVSDGTNHAYDEVSTGGALQTPGAAEFRIGSSQLSPTAGWGGLLQEGMRWSRAVSVADLERIAELIITEPVANWPWYADQIGGRVGVLGGGMLSRGVLGGKLIGG